LSARSLRINSRFLLNAAGFVDCCGIVQLPDGRYRMYLSVQASRGLGAPLSTIYSAVSSDLYNWTLEAGTRLVPGDNPAALENPDGSTLLVYSAPFGSPSMLSAYSSDGLNFSNPVTTNLSGASGVLQPSFVTLPDGRLFMYYATGDGTINAAVANRVGSPLVAYPTHAASATTATT
jgi:hypothetical protein